MSQWMSQWMSKLTEKKKKELKGTDKWYPDQPEWGTPEATKKARDMTPGQEKMDVAEEMTAADAGIPQDTKNMGPRLKTINVTDRRLKKDKHPVMLKRFRKYIEDQNG